MVNQYCPVSDSSTYDPGNFSPKTPPRDPNQQCGSVVQVDNQVLGESIAIPGTGFSLVYRSDRTGGRRTDHEATQGYGVSQPQRVQRAAIA